MKSNEIGEQLCVEIGAKFYLDKNQFEIKAI